MHASKRSSGQHLASYGIQIKNYTFTSPWFPPTVGFNLGLIHDSKSPLNWHTNLSLSCLFVRICSISVTSQWGWKAVHKQQEYDAAGFKTPHSSNRLEGWKSSHMCWQYREDGFEIVLSGNRKKSHFPHSLGGFAGKKISTQVCFLYFFSSDLFEIIASLCQIPRNRPQERKSLMSEC